MSTIKETVAEYQESFKKEIDKVLNGEAMLAVSEIWISPALVDDYLTEKGLEQSEFDSNGWAYDFWATYNFPNTNDGTQFQISGSGWYSNNISFLKIS